MEISSLSKYIALNKLANGTTEVLFAGQPCLTVSEGGSGSIWKINPVFAKLVYGANIFEDIPVCSEDFSSTEEAIAGGLVKLHELGAFNTEYDFPEDSYAATMKSIDEDVRTHARDFRNKHSISIAESFSLYREIMKSITNNTFIDKIKTIEERYERSEFVANNALANPAVASTVKKHYIKSASGSVLSTHDTDGDAMRAYKDLGDTKGVKIVKEENGVETDIVIIESTPSGGVDIFSQWMSKKQVTESIDDDYKKWESDVKATHPTKDLKFKGRVEKGLDTISAEVSDKEDKSYGVWDHKTNKGHVFKEAVEATVEPVIVEDTKILKNDAKFVSSYIPK